MTHEGHSHHGYVYRMTGKSRMYDGSSQKCKEISNTGHAAEDNDAIEDKSHRRIQDGITLKIPTRN